MDKISRREFLKITNRFLTATGLIVLLAPIIAYFYPADLEETPSEPVSVGSLEDISPNGSKTVQFGRYPALVINTAQGLRAYSAVCTHFACIVKWQASSGQIECPCHDGLFDPLDGHVIAGPPPTPLVSIPIRIHDGQIYIGGTE